MKAKRFTLTWRAQDADSDVLKANVAYAADGRTFTTIFLGFDHGRAVIPTEVLTPGRHARFRVTVDDGFDRATADSAAVNVPARPPLIGIFGLPPHRRLGRGQTLVLSGQASETGGTTLPASRLRWYVGKRLAARGAVLRVTMPKKGVLHLSLQARGTSGRVGRQRVTIGVGRTPSRQAVAKVTDADTPGPKPAAGP